MLKLGVEAGGILRLSHIQLEVFFMKKICLTVIIFILGFSLAISGCNKKDFDPNSEAGFDEATIKAEKDKIIYKAFGEYEEDFKKLAQFIDTRDEYYIKLEIETESVSKKFP